MAKGQFVWVMFCVLAMSARGEVKVEHQIRSGTKHPSAIDTLNQISLGGLSQIEGKLAEITGLQERSIATVESFFPKIIIETDAEGFPLLSIEQKIELEGILSKEAGWSSFCSAKTKRCSFTKGNIKIQVGTKKDETKKDEVKSQVVEAKPVGTETTKSTRWTPEEWKEAVALISKLSPQSNRLDLKKSNDFLRDPKNVGILNEIYPVAVGVAKMKAKYGDEVKNYSLMVSATNCGPCQQLKSELNPNKTPGNLDFSKSGDFVKNGTNGDFVVLLNKPDYNYMTPLTEFIGVSSVPKTFNAL